jgi:hypothetical protein
MAGIIEIIGRDGRRRRARKGEVLADGERFSMPMTFQDAHLRDAIAAKFSDAAVRIVDASGQAAGHRPGFCIDAAANDAAAAEAYAERLRRLDPRRIDDDICARSIEDLQAAAVGAYEDMKRRLGGRVR